MKSFEPVLRTPELGPGEMRQVEVHGRLFLIANAGQTYYALDGRCPTDGTPLAEAGRLNGYLLSCPRDDSVFDIRSGERVQPEGGEPLRRYQVRVENNLVKLGPRLAA